VKIFPSCFTSSENHSAKPGAELRRENNIVTDDEKMYSKSILFLILHFNLPDNI